MVYLKDGLMGGYKKAENEEEAVCIGLSKQEYEKLQSDLRVLRTTLEKEKAGREHDKAILEKRTERTEKELVQEYQKAVDEIEDEKDQLKQEIDRLNGLYTSLLMESKKKTSIARKIGKEEFKYRLVNRIIQSKVLVRQKDKEPYEAEVWIATIETPYSCLLPIDEVDREIFRELAPVWCEMEVIGSTVEGSMDLLWKGSYAEAMERSPKGENIIFDYHFQVNVQTRLWEIQITTTGPLRVTEELLPPKKDEYKDNKSGKKKEKKKKEEKAIAQIKDDGKAEPEIEVEPEMKPVISKGSENKEIRTEDEPFVIPWD